MPKTSLRKRLTCRKDKRRALEENRKLRLHPVDSVMNPESSNARSCISHGVQPECQLPEPEDFASFNSTSVIEKLKNHLKDIRNEDRRMAPKRQLPEDPTSVIDYDHEGGSPTSNITSLAKRTVLGRETGTRLRPTNQLTQNVVELY